MNNLVKLSKKTAARLFLARVGAVGACAAVCMSAVGITSLAVAQDNRTTYEYDGLGRLIKERRAAEGTDTTYSYDTLGNRITASDSFVVEASFSVNDVSVSEGGVLTFTITKSGATALSHDVSYATANNSAGSGDYTAKSGVLSFAPSDATKSVTVQTTEDSIYESPEKLFLNLSNPSGGATIADNQGQGEGTINNDDAAPSFSINSVSREEGLNLIFTVTRSGETAFTHNVSYATANGSATAPSDYTAASGVLSFTPAQGSRTITIVSVEETVIEPNETFRVNLSNATNGATISGSQAYGTGTIIADDVNLPPVASNDTAGGEVNGFVTVYPLSNDSDPNGHTLTLTSFSSSSPDLSAHWNASQKKMTLTGHAPGSYYVDYTIIDGFGGSDTGRINVSITFNGGGCPSPPCLPDF